MKYLKQYGLWMMLMVLIAISSPLATAQDNATSEESESEIINSEQYNKWKNSKNFVAGVKEFDNEDFEDDTYEKALGFFQKEVKQHPANGYAYCNMALCQKYIALIALNKQLYELYNSESANMENIDELFQKGKQQRDKEFLNAATVLDKGISLLPPKDKTSLCKAYTQKGIILNECFDSDSSKVVACYLKALELMPSLEAYTNLIDFYNEKEDPTTANYYTLEAYKNLKDIDDDDFMATIASTLADNGETDKAMEIINTILRKNPQNTDAITTRSDIYYQQKNYNAYIDDIITLSNAGKLNNTTSLLAQIANMSEDNLDLVLQKVHKAQELDKEENHTNWQLVEGYLQMNESHNYQKALESMKNGLKSTYTSFVLAKIGECFYLMGKTDNALQFMEDAQLLLNKEKADDEEDDDDSDYLLEKIQIEMNCGLVENVINDAQIYRILKGDGPQSESAYTVLEWAYRTKGCYKDALSINDKWMEVTSNKAYVQYRRAYTLYTMGRIDEAQQELKELLAKEENFDNDQELKFNVLQRLGRNDEAREILETLVANTEKIENMTTQELLNNEDLSEVMSLETMSLYNIACSYSLLGDTDKAIDYLRRHYESYTGAMQPNFDYTILDSDFDNIRQNPEFMQTINHYKTMWLNGELKPKKQ